MRPLVTWLSLAAFLATAIPTALHAEAPTTPPDVVLFAKGGMLRGTISESDPEGDVVIVLVTGETRRVPMSDVKYAGPADEAPKKTPPAPRPAAAPPAPPKPKPRPVPPYQARLILGARQPDVTFHQRVGSTTGTAMSTGMVDGKLATLSTQVDLSSYSHLCTAPCEATIPAGTYRFALSQGGGSPVEAPDAVSVRGRTTVNGDYTSYSAMRTLGWVVVLGGGIAGGYVALSDGDSLLLGLGIVAGSGLLGGLMASKADEARIVVGPLATSRLGPQLATADASWSRRLGLQGITVGARF